MRGFVPGHRWEQYSIREWDEQYTSSTWTYLAGLEQAPRYAIIEGWRRRFKPSGSVLDLGCGEGVLYDQICREEAVAYTGIDLSQVAIAAASKKIRDGSLHTFVCCDFVTFEPPGNTVFDVIVFNEVLYYVQDPVAVVRRYLNALASEGVVIVSIFGENANTWETVDSALRAERLQTVLIRDEASGKRWALGLYRAPRTQ